MYILCYQNEPELNYKEAKRALVEGNVIIMLSLLISSAIWPVRHISSILLVACLDLYLCSNYYLAKQACSLTSEKAIRRAYIFGFVYKVLYLHLALAFVFAILKWHKLANYEELYSIKMAYFVGMLVILKGIVWNILDLEEERKDKFRQSLSKW